MKIIPVIYQDESTTQPTLDSFPSTASILGSKTPLSNLQLSKVRVRTRLHERQGGHDDPNLSTFLWVFVYTNLGGHDVLKNHYY